MENQEDIQEIMHQIKKLNQTLDSWRDAFNMVTEESEVDCCIIVMVSIENQINEMHKKLKRIA